MTVYQVRCPQLKDPGGGPFYYVWFKIKGPPIVEHNPAMPGQIAPTTGVPAMQFRAVKAIKKRVEFQFMVVAWDKDLAHPKTLDASLVVDGSTPSARFSP